MTRPALRVISNDGTVEAVPPVRDEQRDLLMAALDERLRQARALFLELVGLDES